ncbi:peptidyl-prolyl cis-trans isomerase E-like [Folsomia candida]|uniref:peptidyl-prolyl cis-trans isomerase E-like n=1 Tax=Folsomia candida TaxID=158441 RepID=UPI0016053F90|nr:peptidyl-prolyl cis-trans isomerase E-like [Folsomia candida]
MCNQIYCLLAEDSRRTIRVNMAKPMKVREFSTRPVWQDDSWLQKHAGETLGVGKDPTKDAANEDKEGDPEDVKEKSNTEGAVTPGPVVRTPKNPQVYLDIKIGKFTVGRMSFVLR